jgi:enamine deaminase RidA (YjgF/YER057c/UK114 family)
MVSKSDVEILASVKLGKHGVHYARGVRAGPWVFATGCLAQDFRDGYSDEVVAPRAPHAGRPKREKEAELIFDNVEEVLRLGETSLEHTVRTDQYYTTVQMVPPYQQIRRERFGRLIPTSTSIVQQNLLFPGADLDFQLIAIVPDGDFQVKHHDGTLRGRPTSGYSAALSVGNFVFLPGITSMTQGDEPQRNAVATAARIEKGMQWGGLPIKLETEFIINERIIPSLALCGAELRDVVKAQAYLTDPDDYAAFNEVWSKYFRDSPAALSVIPCAERGLVVEDGKLEINVLALKPANGTSKQIVDAGVSTAFSDQPQAVKAGDLLFISALMANDGNGIVDSAEFDPQYPYFNATAERQAECIIRNAQRICEAAGTSLENVVRIQQFHTDLNEFYPVHTAWQRHLPDRPLPFSAVEVPGPLPVPGCTVMMDLWVYVPQ